MKARNLTSAFLFGVNPLHYGCLPTHIFPSASVPAGTVVSDGPFCTVLPAWARHLAGA
jgi:hypothetical protein